MGPVTQGGALSQNHWAIYMLLTTGSTQLNMQLVVKEHAHIDSNTAVQCWDVPTCQNVRASEVHNLILNKGRQKYNMAEGGVGCRWWSNFCPTCRIIIP